MAAAGQKLVSLHVSVPRRSKNGRGMTERNKMANMSAAERRLDAGKGHGRTRQSQRPTQIPRESAIWREDDSLVQSRIERKVHQIERNAQNPRLVSARYLHRMGMLSSEP